MGLWMRKTYSGFIVEDCRKCFWPLSVFTTDEAYRETAIFPQISLCQKGMKNEEMCLNSHNSCKSSKVAMFGIVSLYLGRTRFRWGWAVWWSGRSLFAKGVKNCHLSALDWNWPEHFQFTSGRMYRYVHWWHVTPVWGLYFVPRLKFKHLTDFNKGYFNK